MAGLLAAALLILTAQSLWAQEARPALNPVVEVEEEVYSYVPADNGAAPTWCWGCSILVRVGDELFATGLETLPDAKPLNNVRWQLFRRNADGWALQQADPTGRTREPCPIVALPDGRLIMSANPTLIADPQHEGGAPARPEFLRLNAADPAGPFETLLPEWGEEHAFSEHTYRYFGADADGGEVIMLSNVRHTHKAWALLKRDGTWATGTLPSPPLREGEIEPYGATHCRPHYGSVVLRDRAAYITGALALDNWDRVGAEEAAQGLTGRKWGNRWRRMMYAWTPDITTTPFSEWLELGNTLATGGWLFPGDLWVDPDGDAHVLWYEGPIGRTLRDQHFPDIKMTHAAKYAVVRDGEVVREATLLEGGEGLGGEMPGARPRFHITPDNRLFALMYVFGADDGGNAVRENRLVEILPDGTVGEAARLPLEHPLAEFFTATPRGGSPPSVTLDLIGNRAGTPYTTLYYARVRLW